MPMSLPLTISAIAFLIALSALFSGSETALTAASRARMHRLAREGDRRASRVERLIRNKERLIGAILLGNNLVNILASALATGLFIRLVGESGVVYATLVMTAVVLVFAEVLPKTYAIADPDRVALRVARALEVVVLLFSPVVALVGRIVRMTLALFGIDLAGRDAVLSVKEELRGAIDLGASEGALRKSHRDMLGSILDLDEITVEDVMVHRKNMEMIDISRPVGEIIDAVIASPYSRLPVYDGDPDNIVGVIHAKELLRALRSSDDRDALDIRTLMSPPWFVPETTSLREQMNAFLARHSHFALVVDEYGTLQGLVTLEDILEEIVGDIADEFDENIEGIKRLGDGWILVDGTTSIRDLNRHFDWSLPDEHATTLAGLVIYEAETIPIVGQRFQFHGFEFEIAGRRRNQITQIKVRPVPKKDAKGAPAS
ncbi:MAG: HlyC/CorC family transporter [Alphaproteobacteria bacterium]|nr:MAG: HlyC/CorC family transporter [Alphaproteobacteria bacterium]